MKKSNTMFVALLLVVLFAVGCGMSQKDREWAKKLSRDIAQQKCECDALNAKQDSDPLPYKECVDEYNRRVRYLETFLEDKKPTDADRKEFAQAGDEVQKNCASN